MFIDESLRNQMEKAYLAGQYEEALSLSEKLDEQIVAEQRAICSSSFYLNHKEANDKITHIK
jgi:hypothetical protein